MRARFLACAALAITATLFVAFPGQLTAGNPFNFVKWFTGKGVDVHPHECDECGNLDCSPGLCINRYPVNDCKIGKLEAYDCKIKYEYVSIPETRYYWKKIKITKEIPCPHCVPVCKTEDGFNCFGEEKWNKYCSECGELHCKHIAPKVEKAPCKYCDSREGEATIKVKYWSCVKVPYTVYRQVKRPVCVKQPYYEDIEVPITRYICEDCDQLDCEYCNGAGCEYCAGLSCTECDGTGCAQCSPVGTPPQSQLNDLPTTSRGFYQPVQLFSEGLNDDVRQ